MGFLDLIKDAVGKMSAGNTETQSLMNGVTDLLKNRGISGLMNDFKNKGLGDIASSWIGTGANQPVSVDQLKSVLGNDKLQNLAKMAGLSEDRASHLLRDVLPGLIDKITPDGQIPNDDPGPKSS